MNARSLRLAFATALLALAIPSSASAVQQSSVGGVDHVLIWSRNIDQVTSIMAVKLGFQVRPGGDFGDGVARMRWPPSWRTTIPGMPGRISLGVLNGRGTCARNSAATSATLFVAE